MITSFLSVLIFLHYTTCTAETVFLKASPQTTGPIYTLQNFTTSTGAQGRVAIVHRPIDHFHVYYPDTNGKVCPSRLRTSAQSAEHNCLFAVNGGPFSYNDPFCIGDIISDGNKVLIADDSKGGKKVGLTKDSWVLGDVSSHNASALGFKQLVSAFDWVTLHGKIVPAPGGEIAQRTFVGFNTKGEVLIFQVDGYEKGDPGKPPLGLTLYQEAELVLKYDCPYGINFDGGGSSVCVEGGKIISRPTCSDTPTPICERAVTTILCVK